MISQPVEPGNRCPPSQWRTFTDNMKPLIPGRELATSAGACSRRPLFQNY